MVAGRSTQGWRDMTTRAPAPGSAGNRGDEAGQGRRVHVRSREYPHTLTKAQLASKPTTGHDPGSRKATHNRVLVAGRDGQPLDPCEAPRARKLLRSGRAVRHAWAPFTIRLLDRTAGDGRTTVQQHEVRVDPGPGHTGIAIVMMLPDEDRVMWQGELEHPGGVSMRLTQRRGHRRRRRGCLRYRAPRFNNRKRGENTLPPSTEAVSRHVVRWLDTFHHRGPVTGACIETARFDTQRMQDPEVQGNGYQQGTLAGTHIRTFVRLRDRARCRYCDAPSWLGNLRFTLDHVHSRARGGSDRPSNLVWCCEPCNQAKGKMHIEEFLANNPERLKAVLAQRQPPLAAATHTAWLASSIVRAVAEQGLILRTTTGADTAFMRRVQQVPKTHANDAAFAGADEHRPITGLRHSETWRPTGHGRRKQAKSTKGETYRQWRHRQPTERAQHRAPGHARPGRTVAAVRSGDVVRIKLRTGSRVTGAAKVTASARRVSVKTNGRTQGTSDPGRIRVLRRKSGWTNVKRQMAVDA